MTIAAEKFFNGTLHSIGARLHPVEAAGAVLAEMLAAQQSATYNDISGAVCYKSAPRST
jgi:hypothetical protein